MSCEVHVRFCEGVGVQFPCATRLLACFQYRGDADAFLQQLPERLGACGLKLAMEKTRSIAFGRFARESAYKRGEKPKECTFLGLTHYCGKTQEGYLKVKRRTSRKKLGQSLRTFADWARHARTRVRKGARLRQAKVRITGPLNYDAITAHSASGRR